MLETFLGRIIGEVFGGAQGIFEKKIIILKQVLSWKFWRTAKIYFGVMINDFLREYAGKIFG